MLFFKNNLKIPRRKACRFDSGLGTRENLQIIQKDRRFLSSGLTPTKHESTQAGEHKKAKALIPRLGKYSLAALNAVIIAQFRDMRLAGDADEKGKTVDLKIANFCRQKFTMTLRIFFILSIHNQ
ncbi:hypothetical protein [Bordetella sp. FB-8]|uniref:hypothetical protein n=1 Tax=Bordetella sp. FB-8 TaxID=1159870 RepID=UPI000382CA5E|nr:hypothetical protein [Bordetella sp. FB-8]